MGPRPFVLALALLLPALGAAGSARSAPRIPTVAPPARVRVGGEYVTALPALPAEIEECELLLLPEDGSGRALRLTPEREADAGPLRWRMPRVNATRARLVLRAGGRFGETESPPSEPFAIEPQAPRERAEVLRGEDELAWHFESDGDPRASALQSGDDTTIGAAARTHPAGPRARGFATGPRAAERGPRRALVATDAPPPIPPPTSQAPAFVPLRN